MTFASIVELYEKDIASGGAIDDDLLNTISLIAATVEGMKREGK